MLPFAERLGDKLFLNGIAMIGALVGLCNIAWTWFVFGTGGQADIWMLSLVIVQAFALLSQAGVEQYAIFSAEEYAVSPERGQHFAQACLTWSALFGFGFATLLFLGSPWIVLAFSQGFDAEVQLQVRHTTAPMLLQVFVTPMLYVYRQQLLMKGRERLSVLLNHTFGFVQFSAFCVLALRAPASALLLAWVVGVGGIFASALVVGFGGGFQAQFGKPEWHRLWPFVRASLQLRLTSSVHNFFVVLLTNSALSAGVPGTVALFQYVKRVADGLASIAVGPHMFVYHNKQARAWTQGDQVLFRENILDYLRHSVPMMTLAVLIAGLVWGMTQEIAQSLVPALAQSTVALFVALWFWQLLIAVEGVPAGVVVVARRIDWVFSVNFFYLMNFYLIVNFLLSRPHTGLSVALASLGCQAISAVLFGLLAFKLYLQRFQVR